MRLHTCAYITSWRLELIFGLGGGRESNPMNTSEIATRILLQQHNN